MRINFSRPILTALLTLVLGLVSGSAIAEIQLYDFSWTGSNGLGLGLGLIEGTISGGVISVDTSAGNVITNVTGTITFTGKTDGAAINSYSGTNYFVGPTALANPFFTGAGGAAGTMTLGAGGDSYAFKWKSGLLESNNRYTMSYEDSGVSPQGAAVVTALGGGAPEIDGLLFPKMAFLLGCLCVLFSRKKHGSHGTHGGMSI